MRKPTVGRGREAGVTPNLLTDHLEKIAPTPVLLHEPSPPLESMNNQLMLNELKCAVSSNILSQPLELQCGTLVCTKCLWEWTAASGAVNCSCCSEGGPLVSSHVRPAPGVILLLLSDVLVHCTDCSRDVKAGDYHHLHLSWLPLLQGDLETAQHSQEVLQQVAKYVALVHGEENPLALDLLKQSAAKKEICEGNCMQVSSV